MSAPRKNRRRLWLFLPLVAVLIVVLWVWRPWQRPIVIWEGVNPRDNATMVWVPSGKFSMGSGNMREGLGKALQHRDAKIARDVLWDGVRGKRYLYPGLIPDETPSHIIHLDGYWIYKYEVTVQQYRDFCRATGRRMPLKPDWGWRDDHPIVNVTWHDATAYAAWAGASLPTEAQWEKAARGLYRRVYPWGNNWDNTKLCSSYSARRSSPSPVGSFPAGASPYGAQDMAGNVKEFCSDRYYKEYYRHAPQRNPTGPTTGVERVLRDGSWHTPFSKGFRTASRDKVTPTFWLYSVGFRCVVHSSGP
jgi:formylglycine-generating enzyme required for sulfatase activity